MLIKHSNEQDFTHHHHSPSEALDVLYSPDSHLPMWPVGKSCCYPSWLWVNEWTKCYFDKRSDFHPLLQILICNFPQLSLLNFPWPLWKGRHFFLWWHLRFLWASAGHNKQGRKGHAPVGQLDGRVMAGDITGCHRLFDGWLDKQQLRRVGPDTVWLQGPKEGRERRLCRRWRQLDHGCLARGLLGEHLQSSLACLCPGAGLT